MLHALYEYKTGATIIFVAVGRQRDGFASFAPSKVKKLCRGEPLNCIQIQIELFVFAATRNI